MENIYRPGEIEFTKKELIKKVNNDMVSENYYLIYCRYHLDDGYFYRFKFVLLVDSTDIWEYCNGEGENNEPASTDKKNCISDFIYSATSQYENDLAGFRQFCNTTIDNYNGCNY